MMNSPVHVLLIEDNPGDARLVREELRSTAGESILQLVWADSLEKGLHYLAEQEFQAVLVDLSLPDSQGLETVKRVVLSAPQLPVIVMTGLADDVIGMRAVQAGAQDYLIKGQVDGRLLARVIQYGIERKQIEMQLADALEINQHILTSAPIGIFTYRLSGECLSVNVRAAEMVGATVEQLMSQNFHHIESWKRSGLYEMARRAIATGELVADDVYVVTSFGKEAWYYSQFITFRSGGEELLLMMFEDITERKQAQAALEASESRFRSWIENSLDIVSVLDRRGVIQYESPSVKRLLGYEPEEMIGRNALDFIHPEDLGKVNAAFMADEKTPDAGVSAEFRFRHRDGSWRILESIGRSYGDEHGEIVGLIHSRDITERKEAEEQLTLQAHLLEAVGSAVIASDLEGRVMYWNSAAEALYGWSRAEALGGSVVELTVSQQTEAQAEEIMQTLRQGKPWSGEFLVQGKDGRIFPAFVSDSPLMNADGKLIGVIGVSNDITPLKQAEAALKVSEQRYRDLADNFPNGVVSVYNKDMIMVFDAGLELKKSGYPAEAFIGKHFRELAPAETWEIARPHLQAAFEGTVSSYEASGMDGKHYSVSVAPLHSPDGEIREILVVSQNITSLRTAQSALREKERLLSDAQRIGHIGSWSYEIPADAIRFSDEMYRLLDVLPEEFRHNSTGFLSLIYPADRVTVDNWLRDIRQGIHSKEIHFRIFRKNGELRYLQCTGAISSEDDSQPERFIGTVQDVTERKVAEMEIDQHIQRLTALSRIDRAIISSTDQRYTLDIILSQVLSQLHVDAASVMLVDASGNHLDYAAGQGFRARSMEGARIPIRDSLAGRAVLDRHMVSIPELQENARDPLFARFAKEENFVCYIAVPLVVKGSVKGVLEVYQRSAMHPYPQWLDFLETLAGQAAIAVENAALFSSLQATNDELVQAYEATIEGWSRAMDLRDRETEGHTQRVTTLTVELAQAMGVTGSRLLHIRRGALLHDIGKLGVPDSILFKDEELTPEEWEIMKKHTDFAYEMLSSIHYLKPALNIPYFHHERWDGSGYPLGLKGEQIPLEARIFAVIDVWDALRSDRPYRKAWEPDEVKDYITKHACTHFDPKVVEFFLRMIA